MNKSILITGCSSGIGHAAALALKQRGYKVFAAARKSADVEKLKQDGFESILLDVNDTASIKAGIQQILALTGGTLDAVFNNAGFLQAGAVEDVTRAMDEAQFATNVFGAMEVVRHVLPVMRKQGHGRIIQNSSILGIVAITMCGSYNASKFALEGYSNTLRQELRGSAIHVSIINPGPISSALRENAHLQFERTLAKEQTGIHKAVYEKMKRTYFNPQQPTKRLQKSPEAVVKKLLHALESSRPKAHYYVGFPAHLFAILRRVLPDCMLDWVLVKLR